MLSVLATRYHISRLQMPWYFQSFATYEQSVNFTIRPSCYTLQINQY